MRAIVSLGLCAFLFLAVPAQARSADEAAHERYRRVLAEVSAPGSARGDVIGRLIGAERQQRRSDGARLNALLDAYWTWLLAVRPEFASFVGEPGGNARWTDHSREQQAEREAIERETLVALRSINAARLGPDANLNHRLLERDLEQEIAGQRFAENLLPIDAMNGEHLNIAQVLGAQPLATRADVEDYLERLDGIARLVGQVIARMEQGLEAGITQPAVSLTKVPGQLRDMAPEDPQASPLLRPLENWPAELPAEDRAIYRDSAQALYAEHVRPAFVDLHDFLVERYLPAARQAVGMSALPGGEAWYAHRVRRFTTTEMSPQQVHALGLAEVRRIAGLMRAAMHADGFRGTIAAYAEHLASDPGQFFDEPGALVDSYRELSRKADAGLPRLFGRLPGIPYRIEAMPEHEAAGASAAYYYPGSVAFNRPGVFYVNTERLDQSPRYEMEALLIHEAVPGHHLQIAVAQELEDVHPLRRNNFITAYVEGWALYAESLGPELGFQTEPSTRFGALNYEMWRAVRLVVDTGMHAMGWSRQLAIDFFRQYTGRGADRIEAEVDRYIVWPGQALAYKIGQIRIRELREQAASRLGEGFDIRAFHDMVLGAGALPLDMLGERAEAWIAEQGESPS